MNLYQEYEIGTLCRTCLEPKTGLVEMKAILTMKKYDNASSTILTLITKITGKNIEQEVNFPKSICLDCVNLLEHAYSFILNFKKSTAVLLEQINLKLEGGTPIEIFSEEVTDDFEAEEYFNEELTDNLEAEEYIDEEVIEDFKLDVTGPEKIKTEDENNKKIINKTTFKIEKEDIEEETLSTAKKHQCPICYKVFTALRLRIHIRKHKTLINYLDIPKIKRISEQTKFTSKRKYKEYSNKELLHNCPFCTVENLTSSQYRTHVDLHRNSNDNNSHLKCDLCPRVFKRINHLTTHRVKSHLAEMPFQCEECGKGFVQKNNYDCHIATHKDPNNLPYVCEFCSKGFSNPLHLSRHIIIHTENTSYSKKYSSYPCRKCFKTYKTLEEFRSHECILLEGVEPKLPKKRKYKDTDPLKRTCKICDKTFKTYAALHAHKTIKHSKVLCTVCGSLVSHINIHMRKHTGQGENKFKCGICQKKLASSTTFNQHMVVHSGEKPFICSTCGKAFNNKYNLTVHERIHKGDRCHVCNICNKGFLEKSYLKKHMNVHAIVGFDLLKTEDNISSTKDVDPLKTEDVNIPDTSEQKYVYY